MIRRPPRSTSTDTLFPYPALFRSAELLSSDERDTVGTTAIPRRRTFLIGALPLSLNYDGSVDLLDPTSGFRLGMRISPELSFQSGNFGYVRTQIDGIFYPPIGDRVVLAWRSCEGGVGSECVVRDGGQ